MSLHRRVLALEEQAVEERVRRRLEEELEAVLDRQQQHLPPEDFRRVLEILAEEGA